MRKRPSVLALFPLLAGLGAVGGCSFDPGHDYAVTSTWLLNGAAPDAARCKELGIARFRLTIDGPGPATELEADCDETLRIERATYGGFETSRSFDYGVEYEYTVDALDAKGDILYEYPGSDQGPAVVIAYYGDFVPVDLDTVDVFEPRGKTASFSAEWAFSDGDIVADCARNKVKDVELWIASVTDPDFFDFASVSLSPCEDGGFVSDGKVLARGEYYFKYVAIDDRGAIAEQSAPISASVDEPGDLALPRHKFEGL